MRHSLCCCQHTTLACFGREERLDGVGRVEGPEYCPFEWRDSCAVVVVAPIATGKHCCSVPCRSARCTTFVHRACNWQVTSCVPNSWAVCDCTYCTCNCLLSPAAPHNPSATYETWQDSTKQLLQSLQRKITLSTNSYCTCITAVTTGLAHRITLSTTLYKFRQSLACVSLLFHHLIQTNSYAYDCMCF
jgi:hypothetical protein